MGRFSDGYFGDGYFGVGIDSIDDLDNQLFGITQDSRKFYAESLIRAFSVETSSEVDIPLGTTLVIPELGGTAAAGEAVAGEAIAGKE